MPAILIQHPEHGRMHVYDQPELEAHVARGWSVVPETPKPPPAPAPTRVVEPVAVVPAAAPPAAPPAPKPLVPKPAPAKGRGRGAEGLV